MILPSKPPQELVNRWINSIFAPVTLSEESVQYSEAINAFENLTGYFIQHRCGSMPKLCGRILQCVRIDYIALTSMLKRFQRDAFGVKRFIEFSEKLVEEGKLDSEVRTQINKEVCGLGLRITADKPRKTRIAAAFTLWMCVFRPISFDSARLPEFEPEGLEHFCAALNYWLACTYLEKFGRICLSEMKDSTIRYDRIKHDFTYRQVSLSTLETFYAGIFRYHDNYQEDE